MRKKSHILLAKYLADQKNDFVSLQEHRKAFYFGSILPDLKPSFLTTKHEIGETFEMLQAKINHLLECGSLFYNERVFWRKIGEVMHYIADYFTFPHNTHFQGTIYAHNHYEKFLKNRLKIVIRAGETEPYTGDEVSLDNSLAFGEYIKEKHRSYMKKERNIHDDIRYILTVCTHVFFGIVELCFKGCKNYETAFQC